MTYLREKIIPDFIDSKATSNFIIISNNLLDIFNSKNRLGKYFKPSNSVDTVAEYLEFFENAQNYISTNFPNYISTNFPRTTWKHFSQ